MFERIVASLGSFLLDQRSIQPGDIINQAAGFEPGVRSSITNTFRFL